MLCEECGGVTVKIVDRDGRRWRRCTRCKVQFPEKWGDRKNADDESVYRKAKDP